MRLPLVLLMISTASTAYAGGKPTDHVADFVKQRLHVTEYKRADADLNADGRSEAVVYVTDRTFCGSGGCLLLVLSAHGTTYRVVMRATVTKLPITILPTRTHGWRDLGVTVQGGGVIRPYMARLRFNGHRYPSNPTVPPAVPLRRPEGRVLIGG